MRRFVVGLVLCGCSREAAKPTTPANTQVPQIRFAMTVGTSVQIVRMGPEGLVVERTTKVPALVSRMFWVGPSPAVWLDMSVGMNGEGFPAESFGEDVTPGPHSNELGFVTAAGYVKMPALTWPPAKPPTGEFAEDMSPVDEPNRSLVATKDAVWERKCRWYGGPDGGWCEYEFARRYPEPVVFVTEKEVGSTEVSRWFPTVEASTALAIKHDKRLRDPERGDDVGNEQRVVSCTPKGGTEVVYPPDKEHDVMESVTWLSTEPPIFLTDEGYPDVGVGRSPPLFPKVWEGCSLSTRYTNAFPGPDGVVVLTGDEVSVLHRGREIAHSATSGGFVVFAP